MLKQHNIKMLQKAAKMRLFAFKTSQLRNLFGFSSDSLRSSKFCYVCSGKNYHAWTPSAEGLIH